MVLDDVISEIEKELREARKALRRVTLEWKRIDAKEPKETDAAGVDGKWKAASGAQVSKAKIGTSGKSGVGVNRKSSPGDQNSMSSARGPEQKRKAVAQKESADKTQYESCQQNDIKLEENESCKELGFVQNAVGDAAGWREPLRVKNMCDKKCTQDGSTFHGIASILVEPPATRTRPSSEGTATT